MARRIPSWFKRPLGDTPERRRVEAILRAYRLNTVCDSAACPNRGECYSASTATFMILGNRCTRNCRFCNVSSGPPEKLDSDEPSRLASAAHEIGLRYVVVTSVTRDDLPDGGAGQFAATIKELRKLDPSPKIEILTPDFQGDEGALLVVAEAEPHVWGHNIEVVPRLYPELRPKADYRQSLRLLAWIKEKSPAIATKSALMLGVGETREEILETCMHLREAHVDLIVLGQYMPPSKDHWPVRKFYTPEEFAEFEGEINGYGFSNVLALPWARSSYQAGKGGTGRMGAEE